MLARTNSATPWGIDARRVRVEVDVHLGVPRVDIVGLSRYSTRECRERVRCAIEASDFELPPRRVTLNLAPADLEKQASHLDLAIAIAWLAALGELPPDTFEQRLFCGELGLDGSVRPVRGALALAELAAAEDLRELVLPAANASNDVCCNIGSS
ncbi:MAG: ATP-dependent protease, partial [bacterium]|nr:ATP-dependent protease [bacterium]